MVARNSAATTCTTSHPPLCVKIASRFPSPSPERRDFYLYADEFPSFTTTGFAGMLSEMRKYRVGLVLAHQYLSQVEEGVRDAILGNAGTTIAFRTGLTDALLLEKEFYPESRGADLVIPMGNPSGFSGSASKPNRSGCSRNGCPVRALSSARSQATGNSSLPMER